MSENTEQYLAELELRRDEAARLRMLALELERLGGAVTMVLTERVCVSLVLLLRAVADDTLTGGASRWPRLAMWVLARTLAIELGVAWDEPGHDGPSADSSGACSPSSPDGDGALGALGADDPDDPVSSGDGGVNQR